MERLRADIPPPASVPPVIPDPQPLASFRGNRFLRMPGVQIAETMGHRQNDLRNTSFHGTRRGSSWRLFQITHAVAHAESIADARPQFTALHQAVVEAIGNFPMLIAFSGAPGFNQAYA